MTKITLVLLTIALISLVPSVPAQGYVNPWIPPWIASAPWMPQWVPCTAVGASCQDCSNRVVCTKIGGIVKPCTDPQLPHCNLGACSATPSVECNPVQPEVIIAEDQSTNNVEINAIIDQVNVEKGAE